MNKGLKEHSCNENIFLQGSINYNFLKRYSSYGERSNAV